MQEKGLVHYYFGNGCGKTSIALGHITRALGRDLSPVVLQFLKKHDPSGKDGFFYGEYITLTEKLKVPVFQFGDYKFVRTSREIAAQQTNALNGLRKIEEALSSDYDIVILDEIATMFTLKLLDIDLIIELIQNRNPNQEVIMTGRDKHDKLIEIADYTTHLEEIKHPFQKGIFARPGIEY